MSAKQSSILSAMFLMQALQWIENLDPKVMKDLGLGRAMLDVSHGKDDRDLQDWRSALVEAAKDENYEKVDATGYFCLVASIAIRAIEQIHRLKPDREECDCPSCTLRKEIEEATGGEADVQVRVVKGAEGLSEFLEMLRDAAKR